MDQFVKRIFYFTLVCAVVLTSCKKPTVPEPPSIPKSSTGVEYDPTPLSFDYPDYFPVMEITEDNPTTEEGVELGRKLYYDPILHPQGSRSCASCHDQNNSFTVNSLRGGRSVLHHVNLGWGTNFLWEGKVEGTLEDVMRFEVEDFFGTDVSKLQEHPTYPNDFYRAFGEEKITTELCAKALAQWFRSMISSDSKFDRYLRGEVMLTASEFRGFDIFNTEKGDCFHCHSTPLFTDNKYHNIGLDSTFSGYNQGRYNITGNSNDMGKFKTPTLRNIELTGPYMHDGRFQTLEEVVDFYSEGLVYSPTIDPLMKKVHEGGVQLNPIEKQDLVNFLKTLTDTTFTNNPDLSYPF